MKINNDYILFCEKAIKNENDLVTFINVFDNIDVKEVPTKFNSFTIAIRFRIEKNNKKSEKLNLTFKLSSPKGQEITSGKFEQEIKGSGIKKIGILADIPVVIFPELGEYLFVIKSENKKIYSRSLFVKKKNN